MRIPGFLIVHNCARN